MKGDDVICRIEYKLGCSYCSLYITWEITWILARFRDSQIMEHAGMKSWHATKSFDVFVVKPQQLQSGATTNSKKLRGLLEPNWELYLPQILLKVGILLFELWIKFRIRVNFYFTPSHIKVSLFKRNKYFFLLQWITFIISFAKIFAKNFEEILN